MTYHRGFWLPAALVALLSSCGGGGGDGVSPSGDNTPPLVSGGSWGTGANFGGPWGHDGNPLETENFLVFSGTASQAARQHTADVAEESLAELKATLGVTNEAFRFLPYYSEKKIHILALGSQNFNNNSGFAYRDGLVTVSREHPNYSSFGFTPERYKGLIKHETMHVVEFLLIGDPRYQQASDVWFREGFASYASGPRTNGTAPTITSKEEVEAWRAAQQGLPGGGNPIAIHLWADFPQQVLQPVNRSIFYYPFFELALAILLSPEGLDRSIDDLLGVYEAQRNGGRFERAFEQNMDLSLDEFEATFWDLAIAYFDARAGA